jgi:hypothetical protein
MKVYKLEVVVIDHDNIGGEDIKDVLENTRYPNRCISPEITDIKEVDIGEWDDNHPLNNRRLFIPYLKKLFPNPDIKLNYIRGVLRRLLKSEGCHDGGCILRENRGMVTNGGCSCLKELQYILKQREKEC